MSAHWTSAITSERRTAQLFGLLLGGLFACTLVLNALAY
jgi:hypothetical protein